MAALAVYAKHDAKLGRQVLNLLLPQVTNADFEFWVLDHTLRIYLFKPLDIDKSKLAETVEIVKTRQEEIIASAGVPRAQLASDKQFAALMRDTLQAAKIKMPMKKPAKPRKDGSLPLIPALSKSDPAFIKLTEHPNEKIANVVRARLAVRSAATIAARLLTMQKYADLGIGIPVHLIYYGAHTGRFAGGGGFNFQNLTSPDRATTEIDRLLAQLVRQIIVAGPGKVFVPVDAAQIEARVLAWLAGEQQILDTFATGADIYSEFISEVLGEKIHKPKGDEPKAHQQHLKLMRGIGKIAVLGLGYSMAAVTFFARQLSGNKDIYKKIEAGEITMEFAEKVVQTYREKYTKVVKFWKDLDNAFHDARKGMIRRVGFLTFKKIGPKAVGIVLPNGRMLSYRNIRSRQVEMAGGRVKTEWLHGSGQKVYGGLLAENVTQAVARDILVEQGVYAAEMAGYPVYLHVHDEVVPRVEESKGKVVHDFLVKSLSTAPEWAPGLVLSAEGKVGKDLGK
jgi:DNA polymerase